jgi:hypothetical protein
VNLVLAIPLGQVLAGLDSPTFADCRATAADGLTSAGCRHFQWSAGRTNELVKKAEDTLLHRLSELPGFNGYYLIEAGNGVFSSVGFFDTAAHAEQSTGVAAEWEREQKRETALPNPPKITNGQVVVHKIRELVEA